MALAGECSDSERMLPAELGACGEGSAAFGGMCARGKSSSESESSSACGDKVVMGCLFVGRVDLAEDVWAAPGPHGRA